MTIKRSIYVAQCPQCQESIMQAEKPPEGRKCDKCRVWVAYAEVTYVGSEYTSQVEP